MYKILSKNVIYLTLVFFSGCALHKPKHIDLYAIHKFNAPIGELLKAETGTTLFVNGKYINGEEIQVKEPLEMMIPGSLFIPFPISIAPGVLTLTSITADWRYYCGKEHQATASFPGLGSVIRTGDCVGIRISRDKKDKQWVVDNSNYNRRNTIYTRNLDKEQRQKYQPVATNVPFQIRTLKAITFDGYYGGQLHFTWEEVNDDEKSHQEFIFDFDGKPTIIGIKGNLFTVIRANNTGLEYRWNKIK